MNVTRIGVDLAKNVLQVHGVDDAGRVVLRRRLRRGQVKACFAALPPCLIGMEACGSAHYWAREFERLGHRVKLMAPQFVKPYVQRQKNDANDAQGICEAAGRPHLRTVAVKSVAQQDLQAMHRIRSELVRRRTGKANQIRGLLAEYGVVVPRCIAALRRALPQLLEDADNGLSAVFRGLLRGLREDLVAIDRRVAELTQQLAAVAGEDPVAPRLQTIPGVGPLSATALVAAVGDGRQFRRGRDLAAWLGLTPRQHSSGEKPRLLGMSKHGDSYLRTLLIHGARAVLRCAAARTDPRSRWLVGVATRRHPNVAAVALANKTARIVWALLRRGEVYRSDIVAAGA